MRRISQIEAEEIEFLAPGIPKGMLVDVAGRPGEGKSTWAVDLGSRVSQTGAVIASMHEDHAAYTLRPRFEAAGAVMKRVFIPAEPFMFPRDIAIAEKRIKQTRAKLMICDSAAQHFSVTMTSGQQIRQAVTPLKELAERTGCTFLFIDHLVKKVSRTAHPLEALSGAGSGLPAACRFVYAFGRNPEEPNQRILAPVKVNAIRADHSFAYEMQDAAVFTRDGKQIDIGKLVLVSDESDIDASQVVAFNGGGKATEETLTGVKAAIAQEWLIGVLMFGAKDAKDVQDEGSETGFSWRTCQRAAEKAGVIRKRDGFGPGSKVVWKLPDDHPAVLLAATMGGAAPAPAAS